MFNSIFKKVKEKIRIKSEGNNKKNIENLVFFLILLIITIIAINTIWGTNNINNRNEKNENSSYKELAKNIDIDNEIISNTNNSNEYNLEDSLEKILTKISGVRKSTSSNYIF